MWTTPCIWFKGSNPISQRHAVFIGKHLWTHSQNTGIAVTIGFWNITYAQLILYNFSHFDFSYCGKVHCPEKSVREILDAGDFWHLSWEPQCLKELKQLHSRQLFVFEHQQAHKQCPHHSWSHVVFLSVLWFDSNAENKGACVPASYNADSFITFSFLSKTVWSFTGSNPDKVMQKTVSNSEKHAPRLHARLPSPWRVDQFPLPLS